MPSKDGERGAEILKEKERHHSKSERDPARHRRKKVRHIDPETGEVIKHRRKSEKEIEKDKDKEGGSSSEKTMADVVPELAKTGSVQGNASRDSLPYPPYPSLARAYSKDNIYDRDPTNPSSGQRRKSKSAEDLGRKHSTRRDETPPTPPDTEISKQKGLSTSRKDESEKDHAAMETGPSRRRSKTMTVKNDLTTDEDPEARANRTGRFNTSKGKDDSIMSSKSRSSKASTIKSPMFNPVGEKRYSVSSITKSKESGSNSTSMAQKRGSLGTRRSKPRIIDTDSSPASVQDPSPKTPTQVSHIPPGIKATPAPFINFKPPSPEIVSDAQDSPRPPPPPPPPSLPQSIPRVDYLLKNGGLLRPVSKTLLTVNTAPAQTSTRSYIMIHKELSQIFGPFFTVLDQYESVIRKEGSLAVATGYRSLAQRLLERLEGIFGRNLPQEGCSCIMCLDSPSAAHYRKPLGWGEVLEWVSGRRELPIWPAFDFATLGLKSVDVATSQDDAERPKSPIKMDPDISEEFREHYLQQTKKTKNAVNKWLSSCPQNTSSIVPQGVDEDTLTFAIITHLDFHERSIFNALILGSATPITTTRAPTSIRKPRSDFMLKTASSIQRLHRLPLPPKDAETAIYLIKNPSIHTLLATITHIKPSEWEVLTSGSFDSFLWSGVDNNLSTTNDSPISRNTTPFRSPSSRNSNLASRTTTPFTPVRQPVTNDEEAEIAVLAEVEREIYVSMEAFEDAFESLHRKAESVRQALRDRGAGLSVSLEERRGMAFEAATTVGESAGWSGGLGGSESEDGERMNGGGIAIWDGGGDVSELMPDDSASNISSSRHRRPKRRTERRTPAPVEEEDED